MFDTTQEIPLNVITPAGDKNVVVSFPTDDQLSDRSSKMKLVVRQIGRGKSVTEPQPNEKLDHDLLNKIKVSGDELDEFEAAQVIGRLVRCDITDSVRDGNQFVVTLKVPGAKTIHTLKIPSAKQVQTYSRNAVSVVEGRHGLQEMKMNLRAAGDLYDALQVKVEGYTVDVPLPHKSAVASEVIQLLNQITGQDDDVEEGF